MSRELWAEEPCEHEMLIQHETSVCWALPERHKETPECRCDGGTREPLDFDTIWGRYTRLGKRTWLTKSELRKVIGLEEE